ncbi:hypothetical protein [Profundibacter sp.]|uniref:hypothetical protein n=1 Tax=Profundibacter sp. TaxID=3101071 RepID=UPI003D14AE97
MNRTLILAILVAIIGAGLYFYSNGSSVTDAAGDMKDSVSQAVGDATDTATGAVEQAAGAASDAVSGAADTATAAMDGAFLSPEGYDAVKVAEMIDASPLDEARKSSLKTALMAAGDDPALLSDILGQVKEALGM